MLASHSGVFIFLHIPSTVVTILGRRDSAGALASSL